LKLPWFVPPVAGFRRVSIEIKAIEKGDLILEAGEQSGGAQAAAEHALGVLNPRPPNPKP